MNAAVFAAAVRFSGMPMLLGALWRDRRGHWDPIDFVVLFAVLLGLAAIAWFSWIVWKQRRSKGFYNPRKLFNSLCSVHKLDSSQQRLLLLLAQHHQLPQPATLFLEPDRFQVNPPVPALASHGAELLTLRAKLFADDSQSSQAAPSPQKR
ncbi:MAG TPA: hypothetical protein VGJ15_13225 [Pirellulales bacterium]